MTVIKDRFKTKTGRLTEYAFGCGYRERRVFGTIESTLWREHGTYHVRTHDFGTGVRVHWHSFDTIGKARVFFDQQAGDLVRSA